MSCPIGGPGGVYETGTKLHALFENEKHLGKVEKKLAKADKSIQDKAAKAEAKIQESRKAALANLEGVAAELTQDIATKVAGLSVSKADAAQAVKAALAHG